MRLLNFGAECQSFADRGWTTGGFGGFFFVGMGGQRQSPNGNGGSYAVSLGSMAMEGTAEAPDFAIPAVESEHRVGVYHNASGGWEYRLRNGGSTVADVRINSSGNVLLYVNNVLQATSAGTLASFSWHTLTIRFLMLSSGGAFEVFVGADQVTPFVSFTGNTDPTAATDVETVELRASEGDRFDDIAVQAPSMRYDGGTGSTPIVGELITGGVTSATAVVTAVEAGSDATSGRVLVRSVTGVFQDNEAITGDTAFVAVNNAPPATTANPSSVPGLDTNSGKVTPFGYVLLINPNGVGAYEECSPNPVPMSGENWENVDDWISGSSSTFEIVESGTNGARDFYTLEDVAAGFTGIETVEPIAYATKQGSVINNLEVGVRPASTEYYGPSQALTTSYGAFGSIFDTNPEDGENWETADVNGMQAGFRLTA